MWDTCRGHTPANRVCLLSRNKNKIKDYAVDKVQKLFKMCVLSLSQEILLKMFHINLYSLVWSRHVGGPLYSYSPNWIQANCFNYLPKNTRSCNKQNSLETNNINSMFDLLLSWTVTELKIMRTNQMWKNILLKLASNKNLVQYLEQFAKCKTWLVLISLLSGCKRKKMNSLKIWNLWGAKSLKQTKLIKLTNIKNLMFK